MSKFEITFKRENGSTFVVAYVGETARHATFNAANELSTVGEIMLEVVSVIEVFPAQPEVRIDNTKLINWIESHDALVTRDFGANLEVRSVACQNGRAFYVYDTIPATLSAARDLLGY
jgi:DNA/RNA endonuclease YhcR with UshA esterase domain